MSENHQAKGSQIASYFLFFLGCVDLVRGLSHTFLMHWANDTFAQLDLSVNGNDQLMLMGAFGISNFLTGAIFILVALKAKDISVTILKLILLAYAVGLMGIKYAGVSPSADFYGRYIMLTYFGVCIIGIIWSRIVSRPRA